MDVNSHIRALNERRTSAHAELNNIYDSVLAAGRAMNTVEKANEVRLTGEIEELEGEIRRFVNHENREREGADLRMRNPGLFPDRATGRFEAEDAQASTLRNFLSPNGPREMRIPIGNAARASTVRQNGGDPDQIRAALKWDTGSIGSAVPELMGSRLYETLESEIAVLRLPTTKFVTESGANFDYPKLVTHGIGTQVIAQGTAIGGTDPEFDKTTFGAYKYGQLVQIAWEVLEDTSIDIVDFVMRDTARALGRVIDTDMVLGTGTGEPEGIFASGATGAAGTIATGGTAIAPTYEKLVDLQYSVADSYRNSGHAAWLFSDSTAAGLRKLRDGAGGTIGAPLWQHSTTMGVAGARQPAELLGDPAYTDANVASLGTVARLIAAYGDWRGYGVRLVHDLVFERSDDFGFDTDMVTFRAKWRVDGRLLDGTSINILNAAPS